MSGAPPAGASFTIACDYGGARRWWRVRIHRSVDELRRAAARYAPGTDFSECYGCCHHAVWVDGGSGGFARYGCNGYAGVIRFAPPYVTGEVVAHELVHAAVAAYRMNIARDVRLGEDCGEAEEALAYIYGQLYAQFETRFHHSLDGR